MKKTITGKKKKPLKKLSEEPIVEEILPDEIHLLPIKGRPIFPGIITPIVVPSGKFSLSIDEVYKKEGYLGLVLLKEDKEDKDSHKNVYRVGVIARILKKLNLPDGGVNILINTLSRFNLEKLITEDPFLVAAVSYPIDNLDDGSRTDLKALMRTLLIHTKELAQNNPLFTEEMKLTLVNMTEPGRMADFVCSILNLEKEEYQDVLETESVHLRLEKVILYLKKELELIDVQKKINDQINDKMDKQQRQFFLREQLKAIQGELGLGEEKTEKKYEDLIKRLEKISVLPEVLSEVKRELEKLKYADSNTPDYNVIRNYLDMIDALPWENPLEREIDIHKSKKILDRDHYRLEDVKSRILEFLAVKKLNSGVMNSTILCLVGPPGVGKTSIAKSVAESLGKKFFRISLGGVRDEAEIKGHRRTYIGALPGKIINSLRILKERDPVILLDEIDKLKVGFSGDPAGALLEVLDPEQNSTFRDHYLDLPFDLSKVLFIATANTTDTIPRVLLDRMDVIRLSGYITEEKTHIFKKYLWGKTLTRNGLKDKQISIDDKTVEHLINSYSRESGLRGLERTTDKLVRKIAYNFVSGKKIPSKIETKNLEEYLGIPHFTDERMIHPNKPGTALGLAYTSLGGATLFVEAIFVSQKGGGMILTGKLGKMMNESASIALSYVKSLWKEDPLWENKIHLHVPDGATPKDGPSAGTTMAVAFLSLISGEIIKAGFGMTGEITLTGEVLPIGGLKEKIVAAKRVGINHILLPKDNEPQLREIPQYVKKGMKFYPVNHFYDIIKLLFPKYIFDKITKN